jgi:HlyD family secretion protein
VQLDLKKTAIAVAQAELRRSQETVAIDQNILDSTVVKSPAEGTALYWGQWDRPREGDYLWGGNGFLSITKMGKMLVNTRVNEVDSRKIGVGQKATIRLEAIPDKVYHGKITRMAGLAADRDERYQGVLKKDLSGVMVFEVTVEIGEVDTQMLPTMSATVEILVEELRNVIAVPFSALVERDGKTLVRVMGRGRPVEREVKTGRFIKSMVVVTKGLEDVDVICVP